MARSEDNRWYCQFEGCTRSFTRHEHLQRHVLNHSEGTHTCERCRAHFKRPDLLDRHMARHRQKDQEGTTLMTRKRLWKDSDGHIVTKRPALENQPQNEQHSSGDQGSQQTSQLPLSPPGSASDQALSPSKLLNDHTSNHFEDLLSHDNNIQPHFDGTDELFWETSLQNTLDGTIGTDLFDDIFAPDTASSFNMPYTTSSNYNWLFDLAPKPSEAAKDTSQPIAPTAPMIDPQINSLREAPLPAHARAPRDQTSYLPSAVASMEVPSEDYAGSDIVDRSSLQESPLSLLNPLQSLPHLDEITRQRILDIVENSQPTMPDGSMLCSDSPFLSLAALQSYLDLFFTRFNASYPLLHMSSFEAQRAEPILLLTMLLLGATYADKQAHQLAVCIHDVLRPQIFANPSFNAKPDLWVLQAILLTESFGKMKSGQKQHDMSHLFHGLLINLIRRSDCQTVHPEAFTANVGDLDQQWKHWADLEQKKRLAQICFILDVEHAVLFSQSLCMSAFELRSTLPCSQNIWEAASAKDWWALCKQQKTQPPLLLTELKTYLNADTSARRNELNLLSRLILLHGLMSVAWDMTRRDQTSLGMLGNDLAAGSWKTRMSSSYDSWNQDYNQHIRAVEAYWIHDFGEGQCTRTPGQGLDTFRVCCDALYRAAHMILLSDILDLQIYAGARHILGRPVGRNDYSRSTKVVKQWAKANDAKAYAAVRHAANILNELVQVRSESEVTDTLSYPWILFLAALTLWSFHHAKPVERDAGVNYDEDDMIWDAKSHMQRLLDTAMGSGPDSQNDTSLLGHNPTAGMASIVAGKLSTVRWGLCHDAVIVLKGLVPWRLIGEGEPRL